MILILIQSLIINLREPEEIDNIHNNNIVENMSYDRMMLNHVRNTMGRLNQQINQSVLSLHKRTIENDPFFFLINNKIYISINILKYLFIL